jgi:hypothetical protein
VPLVDLAEAADVDLDQPGGGVAVVAPDMGGQVGGVVAIAHAACGAGVIAQASRYGVGEARGIFTDEDAYSSALRGEPGGAPPY